ncbi:phylloplanin-like [Salvia miltiorrhiza]|uniref:phylloplanin-like n=1 Tax=Salvia miltiorrhiza TaxID=226208 RepID=UPI0025ACF70C|nr:phylloplanin-like [Salvia miltiorrhiza]
MGAEKLIVVMVGLMVLAGTAHGQLPFEDAIVNGTLCCTSTGGCTSGAQAVAGANVSLSCRTILGTILTVAQTVTNSTGQFSLYVNNLPGLSVSSIFPILPCNATVQLPLNPPICQLLSTVNGTLSAVAAPVNMVGGQSSGALTGVFSLSAFDLALAVSR